MNISYYLFGFVRVYAEGENILRLINACMKYNLPYGRTKRFRGGVLFVFRMLHLHDIKTVCKNEKIEYEIILLGGVPAWIYQNRYRVGLWAGIVCSVFLLFFAQKFVWKIDVVGNESITTVEILECLDGYGLRVGTYIPSINADRLQNKLLLDSDKISWVSVNINGNTASIEVRERMTGQSTQSDKPANLVAKKGGKITHVQIMNGNVMVREGDLVSEGGLLVSGIFDIRDDNFRVTRAEGKVFAQTSEEFYIKIPYEYEKKVYTGEKYCDEYLNFFDFSVKISKNSGNSGAFYDKISIVDNYNFPDGAQLPIYRSRDIYYEYETVTAYRDVTEAEELAYFELSNKIRALDSDTVLLRKIIAPEIHEDHFALRCVVVCIEDIAQTKEFEVEKDRA